MGQVNKSSAFVTQRSKVQEVFEMLKGLTATFFKHNKVFVSDLYGTSRMSGVLE